MDLTEFHREAVPNFEGIAVVDGGRLLLISDNDYGGPQGPTHIILVKPEPKKQHQIKPGAFVE